MTTAQCEYQLRRAKEAHRKALQTGDAAAIERTSEAIGRWEVEKRIANGADKTAAMNSVFGPTKPARKLSDTEQAAPDDVDEID